MKYSLLTQRRWERLQDNATRFMARFNPCPDFLDRVQDCQALYQGADKFETRLPTLLPQAPGDPTQNYSLKLSIAKRQYVNNYANVVNYYVNFLFSTKHPIEMQAADKLADFWSAFNGDVNGNAGEILSFADLLKDRFTSALNSKFSLVVAQLPQLDADVKSQADYEELGAGQVTLCSYNADQVYDYEVNDNGAFDWIILGKKSAPRPNPQVAAAAIQQDFWLYDETTVSHFRLTYDPHHPPTADTEVPLVSQQEHGFPVVPVEALFLPDGQWLGNQLRAPQIAALEARVAEAYFLNTVAYSHPVIFSEMQTADIAAALGPHGIKLGKDDKYERSAPPADCYAGLKSKREDSDIQVFHAGNLGFMQDGKHWHSAEAKMLDVVQGQITLKGYGSLIKNFAQRIYRLVALGRGEDILFTAAGFEHLDDFSASEFIDMLEVIGKIDLSKIDAVSESFGKEARKRLVTRVLPDADEETRTKITSEIEKATPLEPGSSTIPEQTLNGPAPLTQEVTYERQSSKQPNPRNN